MHPGWEEPPFGKKSASAIWAPIPFARPFVWIAERFQVNKDWLFYLIEPNLQRKARRLKPNVQQGHWHWKEDLPDPIQWWCQRFHVLFAFQPFRQRELQPENSGGSKRVNSEGFKYSHPPNWSQPLRFDWNQPDYLNATNRDKQREKRQHLELDYELSNNWFLFELPPTNLLTKISVAGIFEVFFNQLPKNMKLKSSRSSKTRATEWCVPSFSSAPHPWVLIMQDSKGLNEKEHWVELTKPSTVCLDDRNFGWWNWGPGKEAQQGFPDFLSLKGKGDSLWRHRSLALLAQHLQSENWPLKVMMMIWHIWLPRFQETHRRQRQQEQKQLKTSFSESKLKPKIFLASLLFQVDPCLIR